MYLRSFAGKLKMILEITVPYVKLVFTTLVVLNSIGIVSPNNKLEHGVASNCPTKSNITD